jgi:hypothetical protein
MIISLTSISATLAAGTYITGAYGLSTNHMTKKEDTMTKQYDNGVFSWDKMTDINLYISSVLWAFAMPFKLLFIVYSIIENSIKKALGKETTHRPRRLRWDRWPAINVDSCCRSCITAGQQLQGSQETSDSGCKISGSAVLTRTTLRVDARVVTTSQ